MYPSVGDNLYLSFLTGAIGAAVLLATYFGGRWLFRLQYPEWVPPSAAIAARNEARRVASQVQATVEVKAETVARSTAEAEVKAIAAVQSAALLDLDRRVSEILRRCDAQAANHVSLMRRLERIEKGEKANGASLHETQ